MQKSKGERMTPYGTPWKTGKGWGGGGWSERVEFMRRNWKRSDKLKGDAPIYDNFRSDLRWFDDVKRF